MNFKETKYLELKEIVNTKFLKTVSAFANFHKGEIYFGITDKEQIVIGVNNPNKEAMKIEQMINTSIKPVPTFLIREEIIEGKTVLILTVEKGKDTPYIYQHRAFKRSDTSTVEVDRQELRRLSLAGINIKFEETKAEKQDLVFELLENYLIKNAGIKKLSLDVLKTLQLYNDETKYNVAAELLADKNTFTFSGVDIVKFGDNENTFLYRETISGVSILQMYARATELFKQYYEYEEIFELKRVKRELIPYEAFREAIANALVHREWDLSSHIQIGMYKEKIIIRSPGGLPSGINEDEYLKGQISILRNPIIARVFNRLNLIEMFGTGITRIKNQYVNTASRPNFNISANNINIELPILKKRLLGLTSEEQKVLQFFDDKGEITRGELESKMKVTKSKAIRIINSLLAKNAIVKEGSGPTTIYKSI